jgi:DNA repair exonuclease SbcCD ATPase subunit
LSFSIEKVRGDGQLDDDLDINYFQNNRPRDYGLLSGAQKLCVMFSLKLGLAYLLRKKIGATMQMLLLDEVDQSLDKASIDVFADIIKYFQKDFTILVITHNDRLKDKFSHVILVEQDQNMVSRAKVVKSW